MDWNEILIFAITGTSWDSIVTKNSLRFSAVTYLLPTSSFPMSVRQGKSSVCFALSIISSTNFQVILMLFSWRFSLLYLKLAGA